MESPCESHRAEEPPAIRLDIHERADPAVEHENDDAVNWEKIGRKRNPEVICVGDNIAPIPADSEFADFAAHKPDPDCMRKLMPENVQQHGSWQAEERYEPEERTERKKPELFRCPESMVKSRDRKAAEKSAGQNPGRRNQKDRNDLF